MEINEKELINIAHRNPLECLIYIIDFIVDKKRGNLTKEQLIDLEAITNELKRDFDTKDVSQINALYLNSKGKLKTILGVND